ncbi:MAG: EamA family transporter [Rickettsiales bacterium]|nr:EamA family transporter [Pseudomonadota bacterium]MDA0966118.1 EamA family transporter [Pseudomonadota bacterium]MDG4543217.1 EamA family transporter [Rickettsiales bacterium]MDG4545415.1 EamA family transporter [Rickettsiales bacterium]MDG4547864.1 EamA family transporter [Rickettsiales bacterium]
MKPAHVALAIAIAIIWGLNFVIAKSVLAYFPTFLMLSLRLLIIVVILAPFLRKRVLPLKDLYKISLVFIVGHFGFMFLSLEHGLDSTVGIVIDQMRVPFAVTLGYFFFGEVMGKKGIFGIFLAILGTFVIVGTPNVSGNYEAFWMLISSSFCWAVYNIMVKNLGDINPMAFIAWVSLLGLPHMFLISLLVEDYNIDLLINAPLKEWASVFYIAIAATMVAHGSWYYLLKKYPVNVVAPYSLLIPFFGVASGVLLLGEQLTWQVLLGGALTVAGVSIIVIRKPKFAKAGDVN